VSQDELVIRAFRAGIPADTVVFDNTTVTEIHHTEYVELSDVGGVFQL
jgi:hypothetical protein